MTDHDDLSDREFALLGRVLKRRLRPQTSCLNFTLDENDVPKALPDAPSRFKLRVMLALLEAQETYDLGEGPAPEQVSDASSVLNDPDVDWKGVACRMTAYFAASVELDPVDLPIYVENIRDMCDEKDTLAGIEAHEQLGELNARADAGENVDYPPWLGWA